MMFSWAALLHTALRGRGVSSWDVLHCDPTKVHVAAEGPRAKAGQQQPPKSRQAIT